MQFVFFESGVFVGVYFGYTTEPFDDEKDEVRPNYYFGCMRDVMARVMIGRMSS